ncbi:MAG: D-alanyl-D-alanine carboxypeptidase family protein [Cypionkella sp.]|uniref:D-alanyl-D-alanine carboxypeptidase family protein n=1 Tax=Cypionkella sp. TaxID=2811411 RepID=UPI002ABBD5F0|nr:D-alanyl-D-alanine carboxypeptidase family protein [Cypionkella sp.]MDZ4310607.1 D-alanyl-D-alanine carboxypeptidase family protein [Cypionkella sp.]
MSGGQFNFSMVFKAEGIAAAKSGVNDFTGTVQALSAASAKAGASARQQATDLESLTQAAAKAVGAQEQLVAAEKRAGEARARAMVAPLANPAGSVAPLQAAYKATETSVASLQQATAGFTVTLGSQGREMLEQAAATRVYQSALDDVRASFNPLFAASRQYEQQLDRIAEAERIGAITAREAAAARTGAAERLMPTQPGQQRPGGASSAYAANIGAQGFDVGVTAAMGMHPAMIGLQQGSQLAGIAQQMGGGATAAKAMAQGLLSIFNMTSLVTIGLVTLGAVGIQGLMSLAGNAKTLEERMGDLTTAFERYKSTADLAGSSSADLARQFGAGAGAAQGLYTILANLDRLSLDQKLKATSSAIRETLGTMAVDNGRGGNASQITEFFALPNAGYGGRSPYANSLSSLDQSVRDFEKADGIDAQTAAMQKLLGQVSYLATLKGGISEQEQGLIDLIKEQADVLLGIQAIETARKETIKRQVEEMVLGYRQEAALLSATAQFGADSLAVEKLKAQQASENLDIRLKELGVLKDSAQWQEAHNALTAKQVELSRAVVEAGRQRVRDQQDQLAAIQRETSLIGASNAERQKANALAEAEIEIRKRKLVGMDAEVERFRAIQKAAAEAARDEQKALADTANRAAGDAFDARSAAELNPYVRAQIEAEKEYAAQIAAGASTQVAAAESARVRARVLSELGQSQADYLRTQAEGTQLLQLELALMGQSEAVRTRVLGLAQAEREIARLGLTGDQAELVRRNTVAQVEMSREIEAQADAWKRVQSAGESAIDGVLDKLRGGDIGGAFEEMIGEIEKGFFDLAVRNPLKNALFGTNLGTLGDVGGLQGIWAQLSGKRPVDEAALVSRATSSVQSMTVSAMNLTLTGPGVASFMSGAGAANLTGAPIAGQAASAQTQAFLRSAAIGGGTRPDAISGLNGGFADPLAAMMQAAAQKFGPNAIQVSSGFRSNERQAQLWQEALQKYGSEAEARKWVAPPGSSRHNHGLAADLKFNAPGAQDWAHQNAGQYGLGFRMQNEPWHIEPVNAGAMMADKALMKFGTTATDATTNLGTLGTGFDVFGNALAQGLSGAGNGGGSGGFLSALIGSLAGAIGIPGFADGGDFWGGLRIVGENGPELEATGASRIWTASQTRDILTSRSMPNAANSNGSVIQLQPVLVNQTSRPVDLQVEETTDARGQRQQRWIVSELVGEGMATPGGKGAKTMKSTFGMTRLGRGRT